LIQDMPAKSAVSNLHGSHAPPPEMLSAGYMLRSLLSLFSTGFLLPVLALMCMNAPLLVSGMPQRPSTGTDAPAIVRREIANATGKTKDLRVHAAAAEPSSLASSRKRKAASQDGAMPYFVGSWDGTRNNWFGDVGIAIVPQKDFRLVSLGRHHHGVTGLMATVPVTLWSVETEEPLAIVNIGPKSTKEGYYHWEPTDDPGVLLEQGREYRISQACTPGMHDKWFDEAIGFEEIEAYAATGTARFVGGVNQSGYGYPVFSNGQFRRAGMVNFKMISAKTDTGEKDNVVAQGNARPLACPGVLGVLLLASVLARSVVEARCVH